LVQAAGGVKRLTAAVFVAARMEGVGADRKMVPRTPEELEKLRRIVQTALGITEGSDAVRKDMITLEEMSFNDSQSVELTQTMQKQQKIQVWWDIAKSALYPTLALGVFAAFWRTFQRMPNEGIPTGVPVGESSADPTKKTPDADKDPANPQQVTIEVLNRLLRENPENMTQSIRAWMAEKPK
jgi:flagellar biosynthesis/type III secretory pathway M-ring protein FliF/YscJ